VLRVAVATPVELVRVHAVNSPKTRSPELLERLPSRGWLECRNAVALPAKWAWLVCRVRSMLPHRSSAKVTPEFDIRLDIDSRQSAILEA